MLFYIYQKIIPKWLALVAYSKQLLQLQLAWYSRLSGLAMECYI